MPITRETLDFLAENRLRNSRDWFHAHRAEYLKYVIEPLSELSERLAPSVLAIDDQLITAPKVGKSISRVYRDTRFSKDKSLYRDVMWVAFVRDKNTHECPPGFVLEFSPDGWRYGCGYYYVPPRIMEAIRAQVREGTKAYRAAQKAIDSQNIFAMEGEKYKRAHFPDEPPKKREWLERRCIDLMHNSQDFDLLFSEGLSQTVAEGFALLAPVYRFLIAAQGYAAQSADLTRG